VNILPTLGSKPLNTIKRADVEAWAAVIKLSPGTVATVRQHRGQILSSAVDDGLLPRNPAAGARMPKSDAPKPMPVESEVLSTITAACGSHRPTACDPGERSGNTRAPKTGSSFRSIPWPVSWSSRWRLTSPSTAPDSTVCCSISPTASGHQGPLR
jgi:hypothetical protein